MTSGFDRIAPLYRLLERVIFGHQLEAARHAHLHALRDCTSILLLGDGDGRCLEAVVRLAPTAVITTVDASRAMLAMAHGRPAVAAAGSRVTFEQADLRTQTWTPASYDAVLTMFVLDCFTPHDVRAMVRRIAPALKPRAAWLFVDFSVPDRGWRRLHARVQAALLYAFFRTVTGLDASVLPPAEAIIADHGFRHQSVRTFRAGSIRSVLFLRPGPVERR